MKRDHVAITLLSLVAIAAFVGFYFTEPTPQTPLAQSQEPTFGAPSVIYIPQTNLTVSGTTTLATTTTSMLNGVIVVDGVHYPQTGQGVLNAINDGIALNKCNVFVPPATYSFTAGTSLSFGGKPCKLFGTSASTTRFVANGVAGGIIYDYYGNDNLGTERANIEISGITFDVNNTSGISAISMGSSNDLNIHGISIINVKDLWAVRVGGIGGTLGSETDNDYELSASHRLRFEGNEIATSTFGTYEGFLCVNCRDFTITNNSFHDLTQGPAALALYVGSSRGVVSHNTFASSTIKSFYSSGVDNYLFTNNITSQRDGSISGGIQIINTRDAKFENNIFNGTNDGASASGGISIYDYSGFLDGHNTINWATTTDITIRNNIFDKAYYGVNIGETAGTDKHYEKENIHIEDNKFYNILWQAVHVGTSGSTEDDASQLMSQIHITGNKEYGPNSTFGEGVFAIVGSSTNSALISDVFISDNHATRSSAGGDSAGIYIDGASDVRIWDNDTTGTAKGSYDEIEITANTSNVQFTNLTTTGLGIGTTTPGSLLSVGGIVNFGSATSTFYSTGGLNLSNGGCYAIGGVCPTIPSLPISIANGGTATTTQVTNGINYFDGTRITSNTALKWDGSKIITSTSGDQISFQEGSFLISSSNGSASLRSAFGGKNLRFLDSGSNAKATLLFDSGFLAIGSASSPTYALDVTGLGHFTGLVDASHFVGTSTSLVSQFAGGITAYASSTIGSGTQIGGLTISGGATTTGNIRFVNSAGSQHVLEVFTSTNSDVFSIDGNGNMMLNNGAGGNGVTGGGTIQSFGKVGSDTVVDLITSVVDRGGGSGGAGLGVAQLYKLENGAGTRTDAGRIKFQWVSAVNGAEITALTFQNRNLGSIVDVMTLSGTKVGIGTTSPTVMLAVASSTEGNIFQLYDTDGNCLQDPDSSSITTSCTSDRALKANIRDSGSALAYLSGFRIRDYELKATGETRTGVVAQEVEKIHPELVSGTEGQKMVAQPSPWILVGAINELAAAKGITPAAPSNDNHQWLWIAIAALVLWNVILTLKLKRRA